MSNPYLPDLEKVRNSYEMSKSEDVSAIRAQISPFHPYKTAEDVQKALDENEKAQSICKKMTTELKNNRDVMLKLIEKDAATYVYADKNIKTDEFKQQAIVANTGVYGILSDADRQNQEINDTYLAAKMSDLTRRSLDFYSDSLQFKTRFSEQTNKDLVFSEDKYREHYEKLVDEGPYVDYRLLGEDYAFVAAARLLNQERTLQYDQIERDYWKKHEEEVITLATKDRSITDNDHILTAIEERCPEYVQKIREVQERREELINQISNGKFDQNAEMDDIQRQLVQTRLVELQRDKERVERESESLSKTRKLETIEKEQRELLVYYKASAESQAYDMAAVGDISFAMATDTASYISNTPNQSVKSALMENIASIEAKENDNHNLDMQEEQRNLEELDREWYYDEKYADERNLSEEEMQKQAEEYYDAAFEELPVLFEDIIEKDSEEQEWSPFDWKHSPPDEERHHEYHP